jgi:hypothetical protein
MEQAGSVPDGADRLLTGDLGVVVLQSLLEHGVGYVVSSWRDRPTPIDAAIDDARDRVLGARGVVLRRLRSLSALESTIVSPTGGVTGQPPRGAVIFGGRRGLRPTLERFVATRTPGAVVGFCFDEDALRIEDAVVIDPDPTAAGLARAIAAAIVASRSTGRPALVVLRERALGMRGTIRRRGELRPAAAAELDAAWRDAHEQLDVPAALDDAELVRIDHAPNPGSDDGARVVYAAGPVRVAVQRALAHVDEALARAGSTSNLHDVTLVSTPVPTAVLEPSGVAAATLERSSATCVLASSSAACAARLSATRSIDAAWSRDVEPGSARGEQVVAAIAAWLLETDDSLDAPARSALEQLVTPSRDVDLPRTRVPRRNDVLHRSVSPTIAAGLQLAQGVIGVPSRIDTAWPTYRTDTGVPLSIVPAATFATHGIDSAAPGAGAGVVLIVGSSSGVLEQAAVIGATVEHVDASSPRAIGVAVAGACRSPRASWHVVVTSEVQHVAGPRGATFGMDPDLVGTDRLSTAAIPTAATVQVDLGDELFAGPAVLALDTPETHAMLPQVRELSPATWDLRRTGGTGRAARASWNLHRRAVRAVGGIDL